MLVDKGHVRDGGWPRKSKSLWRTKRSVSSCIALDRISFLLQPPSPPSHKHKLKILTKQKSFFFGPQYNPLRGKVNRRFHRMAVMVVMVWCQNYSWCLASCRSPLSHYQPFLTAVRVRNSSSCIDKQMGELPPPLLNLARVGRGRYRPWV